jgi:phospholipid/cholesterol/gamma-HCH transport system substrate-binding protein
MRSHFINYTTVGVFVAAMIVALLWALTQISGRTGPTDGYEIVMDAVTDIDYGTLVRYEGYKIGQVERIEPEWLDAEKKYQFRVFVSVEKAWKFPADSVARISASSFLAAKTVEVFGGKSADLVAVNGVIPSGPPADAFSLMAQVAGQIGDLSENSLKPLISHVDELIMKIGTNTDQNLEELFASLQAIAAEVQNKTPKITDDISTFTTQMNATLLQADKFVDDQNLQSVRAILNNTEKATKDASAAAAEVKALSGKLQNLADQVNDMIGDNRKNVDKSLANLEYILRSVAQNIDSITRNIDGTARNMSEFSRLIRQNPGLLLNGGSPEADQGLTPASSSGQ